MDMRLLDMRRSLAGAPTNRALMGTTSKQKEFMDFLVRYIAEHHISPSYDEIKDGLGLASKSGIHRLVMSLLERGAITQRASRARSIYPTSNYLGAALSMELLELVFDIGIEDSIEVLQAHKDIWEGP